MQDDALLFFEKALNLSDREVYKSVEDILKYYKIESDQIKDKKIKDLFYTIQFTNSCDHLQNILGKFYFFLIKGLRKIKNSIQNYDED
jgi:hypothetical protein